MNIRRVLIANRGEIAVRVVRACHDLGIEAVVATSTADRDSLAARLADQTVCVGPAISRDSYLNQPAILAAALGCGADAIHPGYGFLAENATFADACQDEGLIFVGPSGDTIRSMGDKLAARAVARRLGVPLVPGSEEIRTLDEARAAVAEIGLPVVIKASAGGGGRGIRVVHEVEQLESALMNAAAEAEANFGDRALFIERYITSARHIEVQILADQHGNVVSLGERDCSLQRRYQKVVEEAPPAGIPVALRAEMSQVAVDLAVGIGYQNAGTVEFVFDSERREFYFLEMNTRIQVEHPVTEAVTGLDLVALQLQIADGDKLPIAQSDVTLVGHAIECRITAESADQNFRPSPGQITRWVPPSGEGIRLDTHCFAGYVVPPFYDSLLGKLIVIGADRDHAIARMKAALDDFVIEGIETTVSFLADLIDSDDFRANNVSTTWIERTLPSPH